MASLNANRYNLENHFQIDGRNGPNISLGINEMQQSEVKAEPYYHRHWRQLGTSTISCYYDWLIKLLTFCIPEGE